MKSNMEQDIITIVSSHGRANPIGRKELASLVTCSDRHMREVIAHIPDIGQANEGYFWKRCEDDFTVHDKFINASMRAERERLARNKQKRLDRQHEPGFFLVDNWRSIPVPSFLRHA